MIPRVQATGSEGLEVPDVSRGDGHVVRLRDRSDKGVVQPRMFRNAVTSKDPRGRKVKGQHTVSERRQDALLQPPAQNFSLPWVGAFFGDHATLDLGDGGCGHELVGDGDGGRPSLDRLVASPDP